MTPRELVERGIAQHRAGRAAEALTLYRQALALDPGAHVAMMLLGVLLLEMGQVAEATELLAKAVAMAPDTAEYHNVFAAALARGDRLSEAAGEFRRAVQLRANYVQAYVGLGQTLIRMGDGAGAAAVLRSAVALQPGAAALHTELANALRYRGQLDEALISGKRAVQIEPDAAWGHNILGLIHLDRGELQEAIASLRRAISLRPQMAEAHLNIARVNSTAGNLFEAIEDLKRAALAAPHDPRAWHNLGVVLSDIGQADQAIKHFHEALRLRPVYAEAHRALLMTLNYHAGATPRERFEEHRRWGTLHGGPLANVQAGREITRAAGRLRIGYVSADFCAHPVSSFIEPILQAHDRGKFEIFCYADVHRPDEVTRRLQTLPVNWRDIAGVDHDAAARQIEADGIDILVDLGGHTRRSRLLVFARKPAAVQVTYLGYPNTTGLPRMDYRLTDAWADPPGEADELHTEKLARLPRGFLCYQPPADSPAPNAAGRRSGDITFASFNNMAKITRETIGVWAKILAAIPPGRLLLKNSALGDSRVRGMIAAAFAAQGIKPERLDLRPPAPTTAAHLAVYHEADISLDTFPYNGTTTTCEALWMGVPVVTWTGNSHAGRVGTSILRQLRLDELIGQSWEQYVQIAVRLANETARLDAIRSSLRERLNLSPLMDAKQITGDIETAYEEMAHLAI